MDRSWLQRLNRCAAFRERNGIIDYPVAERSRSPFPRKSIFLVSRSIRPSVPLRGIFFDMLFRSDFRNLRFAAISVPSTFLWLPTAYCLLPAAPRFSLNNDFLLTAAAFKTLPLKLNIVLLHIDSPTQDQAAGHAEVVFFTPAARLRNCQVNHRLLDSRVFGSD